MLKAALPLTLVAAVAVLARTWQLSQNDFGRQYYAAGVRSMLDSWHNFLFNAFDPAGFVSIDKPPVAIWLQVASAKLLGFSALSILLAQVMRGIGRGADRLRSGAEILGQDGGRCGRAVARAEPGQCRRRPLQQYRELSHPGAAGRRVVGDAGSRNRPAHDALRRDGRDRHRLQRQDGSCAGVGSGAGLDVQPRPAGRSRHLAPPGDKPSRASSLLPSRCHGRSSSISRRLETGPMRAAPGTIPCWSLHWCINGAARFLAMSTPAGNPAVSSPAASGADGAGATTEVRQPVMTDDSPTGPLRLFRPRAAAQFAWLLPLALAGLTLAWSDAQGVRARRRAPPHQRRRVDRLARDVLDRAQLCGRIDPPTTSPCLVRRSPCYFRHRRRRALVEVEKRASRGGYFCR